MATASTHTSFTQVAHPKPIAARPQAQLERLDGTVIQQINANFSQLFLCILENGVTIH